MFTIAALCVIIGLLYYLLEIKPSRRMKLLTSNMPSPKHYPIIGCALEFGTRSDEILQGYQRISSIGPVVAAWIGSQLYVILSGTNEIQTILSNNKLLAKAGVYEYLHPWLGNGLLNSAGEEWRRQRKLITPAFHFKILEQFIDTFSSNLEVLINILKKEVGKDGFDIADSFALCTLDIISETSMGTQIHAQLEKKEENSFVEAINDVSRLIMKRIVNPWLHSSLIFDIFPEGRLFHRQIGVIHKFVTEVVDKKRKKIAKSKTENNTNDKESSDIGEKKKSAFLDLLIDCDLTDKEIKEQVNTFMFAGHDTTASALSFTLYCLMKHPDVQEKVFKEQQEILGDSNGFATSYDLKNMKYLECVINESLRLYPVVPYIGRKITEDFQLTPDFILPKGCSVTLVLYELHRDPKIFPNPEVFNPDRFLPEEVKGRNPFAFCPFSAGPRNCIGQKFAMLELKATLSAIIQRFKILPPINCPDIIVGSELILRSLTGVYVRLENR